MVKLARDVGKGLSEDVRDAMGLLNSQVGYVYLVDTECRIRWAGSGNTWKERWSG
jgi:ATPase complex subunit ATP10